MTPKSTSTPDSRILEPGRNCWCLPKAQRVAVLIDTEAYFAAFASAVSQARQAVYILGWDFDRRVALVRDGAMPDGLPAEVGAFLDHLVRRRDDLRVYLLCWDFNLIYTLERDLLPSWHLGVKTHRRFHFCLDSNHPVGGSHHQKVVVVDDKVAFCGGIDLSRWRWDTPEHRADDERRIDPDGKRYPPYHDVQLLVDGPAARRLGDLARARWHRATGERLSPCATNAHDGHDPWPKGVDPDFDDLQVGVARTEPAFENQNAVREVEALYEDSIAAARRWIYVENQYLSSHRVREVLAARLREEDGPDVVLVLPRQTGAWLERHTMDVLRARLLHELQEADRHGRLRVYYPVVPGLDDSECLSVHAKVMIIDDRLLRVGSSNTSNRSMGLDTECDLAIEADGNAHSSEGIAAVHHRLLAEHLDRPPDAVEAALREHGSLIRAVESLRTDTGRTLQPLTLAVDPRLDKLVPDSTVVDPNEPIDMDFIVANYVPKRTRPFGKLRALRFIVAIAGLVLLAMAWRWTPLNEWLTTEQMGRLLQSLDSPAVRIGVGFGGFVVAALAMAPITVLILVLALVFGPWEGFAYAMSGALVSGAIAFNLGKHMGHDNLKRMSGSRLHSISQHLANRGVLAVAMLRLLPVAPFTVVNLVMGASHVQLMQFLIGSFLGLLPTMLALCLFASTLFDALFRPNVINVVLLIGATLVLIGAATLVRRWLGSRR